MRKLILVAILQVLLVGSPATAQEELRQTPENAQRFIATVLPGITIVDHRIGDWVFQSSLANSDWVTADGRRWRGLSADAIGVLRQRSKSFKISQAETGSDVCWTELSFTGDAVFDMTPRLGGYDDYLAGRFSGLSDAINVRTTQTGTHTIDWTRIASARTSGASVYVVASGKGMIELRPAQPSQSNETQFVMPDENLAARLAYAIEFLRLSCDPAADTGF